MAMGATDSKMRKTTTTTIKIALLLVLSIIILWFIIPSPAAEEPEHVQDKPKVIQTRRIRKECREINSKTGTDIMISLRRNSYACDIEFVDLDKAPDHQLPLTFHSILDQLNVICRRKIRMGKVGDGGWEVCDDVDVRPRPPCIVYSFGISWDFSFDDSVAKMYGCHVYSFDPSMNISSHDRSDKVHFYNIGLSGETGHTHKRFPKWDMYTFKDIRKKLGHMNKKIDIVKIDIEHSEWDAFPSILATGQLKDVQQLLMEYHAERSLKKATLLPILKSLQDIEREGFKKFDVHKNWHCKRAIPQFPGLRTRCYEVHYMKREQM